MYLQFVGAMGTLDLKARKTVWQFDRANEFQYQLPNDKYTRVTEHRIDVLDTRKRLIYALSDLHIGGNWSDGMDSKLRSYFERMMVIAKDQVSIIAKIGLPLPLL